MEMKKSSTISKIFEVISWILGLLFIVTGILNLILVHWVPGTFYLIISVVYLPQANHVLKKKFGFSISLAAKIIFGLVILWGTLAVGDLAEILGL
jgi:hypothetical protein